MDKPLLFVVLDFKEGRNNLFYNECYVIAAFNQQDAIEKARENYIIGEHTYINTDYAASLSSGFYSLSQNCSNMTRQVLEQWVEAVTSSTFSQGEITPATWSKVDLS